MFHQQQAWHGYTLIWRYLLHAHMAATELITRTLAAQNQTVVTLAGAYLGAITECTNTEYILP